ncbi:MAG: DedA family protein [Gemmatimonadota bacterium]|nr:DedA family protein [Gemmatimonadota bacterium]
MHGTIGHLIGTYGYGVLFVLVAVESLGIPLPGETALVTAAAFAANGHLEIGWVFGIGAVAAILGDNSGYWLGRTGGLQLIERYGHHVGLSDSKLATVRRFYERHGSKTVLIGRFIAILRSWAAVLAGVMRMPYPRFVAFNAAGCILWTSVFTALGYLFGRNLPLVEKYIREVGIAVGVIVVIAVAILIARRRGKLGGKVPDANS